MMPSAMTGLIANMIGAPESAVTRSLGARGDRAFDMVERRLGESAYFAGDDFTAADIIMLFPLTTMRLFSPRDISPYPNLLAYLRRIGARPAYRRAMQKADPDLPPHLT
jgi:glutathione S-transferase